MSHREEFNKYILFFLIGSCLGWVIEVLYRSIMYGHIVNPGFLSGPYLPIYGFCLILLVIISRWKMNPLVKILVFTAVATLVELFSGWFFQVFFNLRLWDYTMEWCNYKGWICPLYVLYWALAASLYYLALNRLIIKRVNKDAQSRPKMICVYLFFMIVFFDAAHSFYGAEQIRDNLLPQRRIIPVLTDYKILTTNRMNNFFSEVWDSLKNYSNYKLPEKILSK